MKTKRLTNKEQRQPSDHDAVLKLLVEFQRKVNGVPLADFLTAAKQNGIKKPKASFILKKLEAQNRIKIEKTQVIYPGENYYFWHEELD